MTTAADIRAFANIPAAVSDDVINPHLERGKRYVEKRAGREITESAADADWQEAVKCMALYFLLPVINTLYLDGASTFARDCDDMTDYVFCSPSQVAVLQNYWRNRAETIMADIETETGGNGNVMVEVI